MVEMTSVLHTFLIAVMSLLAVGVLLCLVCAIRGPRFTDRIVALNEICTLIILLVCVLSFFLGQSYLMDVAILYGLLNLLAVALISRISVNHHRNRKEG